MSLTCSVSAPSPGALGSGPQPPSASAEPEIELHQQQAQIKAEPIENDHNSPVEREDDIAHEEDDMVDPLKIEQTECDNEDGGDEASRVSCEVKLAPTVPAGVTKALRVLTKREQKRLKAPRRDMADKQPYICAICCTRFTLRCSYNRHIKKFHIEEEITPADATEATKVKRPAPGAARAAMKQLVCPVCGKRLTHQSTLRDHVAQLHGPLKTCPVCAKPFYLETDFDKHNHDTDKPFSCDLCDKRFALQVWLDRHKTKHDTRFVCAICGKGFSQNCQLLRHKPVHTGERRYACHLCDKSFKQKLSLKLHLPTHSGELRFGCDVCKKRYHTKSSLTAHMKGHRQKPFACNVCDKRFLLKSLLQYHEPVHSGDKPFVCSMCDKRFTDKAAWQAHEQKHYKKKQFSCELCSKLFTCNFNLTLHMKNVHLNDRPFTCDLCPKRFARNHHLKRHLVRHQGNTHMKIIKIEGLHDNDFAGE